MNITLGNFRSGHLIDLRRQIDVPLLNLVCRVHTFLKKAVLLLWNKQIVIVRYSTKFLRPRVDALLDEHEQENARFQQDRAIAPTAYRSMPILGEIVYGHVASLCDDIW